MYIIRIAFTIKKDKLVDFMNSASQLSESARQFVGCQHYNFYNKLGQEAELLLYEEWSNKESFEKYKNSGLFQASSKELFNYMESAPSTTYFTATVDFKK